MTLNVESASAFRTALQRRQLVEAIVGAVKQASEPDWLEWKTDVDLAESAWRGKVASFMLGAANREPFAACRFAEGHAYLVLGAAPEVIVGVPFYDQADIESWLSPYLGGADGPVWDSQFVRLGEAAVLVIEVDPPATGHGAFPLARSYTDPSGTTVQNGTVFIRRAGKTERANAAEIRMLNARASVVPSAISVSLVCPAAPELLAVDTTQSSAGEWVDREQKRLATIAASLRTAQSVLMGGLGQKTPAEYRESVERYLAKIGPLLPGEARARAIDSGLNGVHLRLDNLTDTNYTNAVIALRFPRGVHAFFSAEDARDRYFPSEPKTTSDFMNSLGLTPHIPLISPYERIRITEPATVRNTTDGSTVTYAAFNLRPRHGAVQPVLYVFADPDWSGKTIEVAWSVTATSADGVAAGMIPLSVRDGVISIPQLMALPGD